ncbi:ribosomal protein subunit L37 [Apiospora arundinis]|uniref:Large ribosomal subunit protein mL54 n=1 Tax=Apiospora arundinis TaxID=335852 RepID=A0ABR2J8Q7_9PEZI
MICRRCLQRASSGLTRRVVSSAVTSSATTRSTTSPFLNLRALSTTLPRANAAATAPSSAADQQTETPSFSTPLADSAAPASEEGAAAALSACPAGTVLTGLNYFKNQTDPVALADEKYPEWLWSCLEVQKKTDDATADDAADEFSKSKKQRRLAAKRQRTLEARLMAEGNLEALAPKVPLQQQSINMPGNEEGTAEGAVAAAAAREDLRKAMRKERKAKIKESNYLKSM